MISLLGWSGSMLVGDSSVGFLVHQPQTIPGALRADGRRGSGHDVEDFGRHIDAVACPAGGLGQEALLDPELDSASRHSEAHTDAAGMPADGDVGVGKDVIQDAGGLLRHALAQLQAGLVLFVAFEDATRVML